MEMCCDNQTQAAKPGWKMRRYPALILCLLLPMPSLSATPPQPPSALKPLLQCRTIADSSARLACYDGQVDSLQKATAQNDVVVVERSEIQNARRSIFGLTLPTLSFLDRDPKGHPVEIDEINAKVASAFQGPTGSWIFTLDDGARWSQIEGHEFVRDPKPGMPVRIRKAAMGSYLANFDGQTAVRVERLR